MTQRTPGGAVPRRLRVDPVACTGIGLCALIAPRVIALDEWGFPLPAPDAGNDPSAARAARACPRQALHLEAEPASE